MFKERVAVITDSTRDLDHELAQEKEIDAVVPLSISFGEETFLDRVELSIKQFYEKLARSRYAPMTSAPSIGIFQDFYQRAIEKRRTKRIFSIHLPPPPISATIENAKSTLEMMKEDNPKLQFEIVDSGQISLGLGIAALKSVESANRGKKPLEIKEEVTRLLPRIYTFGVLATLEYARRGGRLSLVEYLGGTLLQIKPLLQVHQGKITAIARIRTMERAVNALIGHIRKLAENYSKFEAIAIIHANAPDNAQRINENVESLAKANLGIFEMGPALGAHGGPGTVGVSVLFPPK